MSIDPDDVGDLQKDVARRLAWSRRAIGLNQTEFGRGAALSQERYNQYEKGARPLTLKAAMALCERYLLTLDWLYRGDPSGLPARLHAEIMKIRKADMQR